MKLLISKDAQTLGQEAAKQIAKLINQAINEKGNARIILSTGASQFSTIEALIKEDIDWSKVEMFHLDEYIGIDQSHPASFVKYLKERFVSKVNLKKAYFVDPSNGVDDIMAKLQVELWKEPVDVGVIGIGENGHIAFNDPIADFENTNAYKVVELDEPCRRQQLGEGWFPSFEDVPTHAITMTVQQIMKCKHIVTAVPFKVKAEAIRNTFEQDVSNRFPSTILKTHEDWYLYLDEESSSLIDPSKY